MARPLTKPGNIRSVISKVCTASKAHSKFDDAAASKFLKSPLFSGCPMPKLEAAKTTKKRAPPSVASGASTSAVVRRGPHESSASEAYSDGEEVAGRVVCAVGLLRQVLAVAQALRPNKPQVPAEALVLQGAPRTGSRRDCVAVQKNARARLYLLP